MEPEELELEPEEKEMESVLEKVEEDNKLYNFVMEQFNTAKTSRFTDEKRWITAYKNYRGIYGPDVQFTKTEQSKVFVKVTKTKVLAAYQQISDVLFAGNKFPISVEPTVVPEGIEDAVHFSVQEPEGMPQLKPGETFRELMERVGPLKEKLEPVKDKLKKGEGTKPGDITYHPSLVAAKQMEKEIHDKLSESHANKHLRVTAFEGALFGSGVIKGPIAFNREYPKWTENGYEPVVKKVPHVEAPSIWNIYPDPEASNMEEAEFLIQRHKLSEKQLMDLKDYPNFIKGSVDTAKLYGPDYQEQWWESDLEDYEGTGSTTRYEVLEYWGYVDPKEFKEFKRVKSDYALVNIWVCNGTVLCAKASPYKPHKIPYHIVPYEVNPYSFWGIGVAENMDDSQTLMNGFARLAVDNALLSGNVIFEIDEMNLTEGSDLEMYPGATIRREGGAPGQALFVHSFPNTSQQNLQMFQQARALADESTGIPSYSHGQTGIQGGPGRTAAGISMLMGAASGAIKTVVKNFDDYLLAPLGDAMFNFIMQYSDDVTKREISGDLAIKARGTEALMANEVRSQRLLQFLQVGQNPAIMPFMKMDYIISEIAKSLDLDPEKVVNNMGDAAIQAQIMQGMMPQQGPQQGGQQQGQGVPTVDDTQGSGNANIGAGMAPTPQEEGFTGEATGQQPPPMAGV